MNPNNEGNKITKWGKKILAYIYILKNEFFLKHFLKNVGAGYNLCK